MSVPFLLSCEDDNFLSLPTDPGQPNLQIQFSRIAVPYTLVQLDSVRTTPEDESSRSLAGRQEDATFGRVSATTYLEFNVGGTRPAVEAGAQYDSLVLQTRYDRSFGVASGVRQALNIRRVTELFARPDPDDLTDRVVYYSKDALSVDATAVVGTALLGSKPGGTVDTVQFRLDDTLGQDFFRLALDGDSTVIVSSRFQEYFNGLALTPGEDNSFVASFDARGARMLLYFTDADGEAQTYEFPINRYFNTISSDRTGTPLATLTVPDQKTASPDGRFYLQSGAGLAPQIDLGAVLDTIRGYSPEGQQTLLNRVDLYIGLTDIADTLNAPRSIFFYNFGENYLRIPQFQSRNLIGYQGVVSDQTQQGVADAAILNDSGQYQLSITNYMASLINSETTNTEYIVLGSNYNQSTQQLVTLPDSVYLDVYYSVLAQ